MLFDRRIELLELAEEPAGVFAWRASATIWAQPEYQKGTNIFSKVGIGARSVLFSMHPRKLTPHQAIFWQGRHHFITAVDRKGPVLLEVLAAQVEPRRCTAKLVTVEPGPDKRAKKTSRDISFPSALTEKYLRFTDQFPTLREEAAFVLVTPKVIRLEVGDLVMVEGLGGFEVQLCHMLDEYKNEYEVYRKGDAGATR